MHGWPVATSSAARSVENGELLGTPTTGAGSRGASIPRSRRGRRSMPGFRQELVGLFGQPVDENLTQAMIEAGFAPRASTGAT